MEDRNMKSQEEKIKEFIKDLSRRYQEPDPHESLLLSSVINEAIQFGSLLTIERAREKVGKLADNDYEKEDGTFYCEGLGDALQAIEESNI